MCSHGSLQSGGGGWIVDNHHVVGDREVITEDCKEIDTCIYDSDPNNRPVQVGAAPLHPLVVHVLTAVPLR